MTQEDTFLTPLELFVCMGSTLDLSQTAENPMLPLFLISVKEGITPDKISQVNAERLKRGEVKTTLGLSIMFGIDVKDIALVKLAELDPITGKAREWPTVSGIIRRESGQIDRDNLQQYKLTESARDGILKEFPILGVFLAEKKG